MSEKVKVENKGVKPSKTDTRPKKLLKNKAFDTKIVSTGNSKNLGKKGTEHVCTKSAADILVKKGFATIIK